jgi:hypothetical protein
VRKGIPCTAANRKAQRSAAQRKCAVKLDCSACDCVASVLLAVPGQCRAVRSRSAGTSRCTVARWQLYVVFWAARPHGNLLRGSLVCRCVRYAFHTCVFACSLFYAVRFKAMVHAHTVRCGAAGFPACCPASSCPAGRGTSRCRSQRTPRASGTPSTLPPESNHSALRQRPPLPSKQMRAIVRSDSTE